MQRNADGSISISWAEWQASRADKRATLEAYGCADPSRRATSFNVEKDRIERAAFNGARIPPLGRWRTPHAEA